MASKLTKFIVGAVAVVAVAGVCSAWPENAK